MDFFTHYLQIVILGVVEGLTEFLPISSTGHLLIAEGLLGVHESDVFNVVIQAGAILAVVFIYWNKITDLVSNLDKSGPRNYVLKILMAFVITGVIGLLVTKMFHLKLPETLTPVAYATLIGGLVIFVIEFLSKNLYPHDDISWFEAVLIGLAQILAGVFPGTSRSGATIMTGLALGMKRPAATEFSFLLGIPTMFAASALDLFRYRKDLTTGGHQLWLDIILGFIVSFIVAFFVIKWLLRFVQSHTFNGFAIYRVLLGVGLLIALSTHAIPEMEDDEKPKLSPAATNEVEAVAPPVTNAPPAMTNTEVVAPTNPETATQPAPASSNASPYIVIPPTTEDQPATPPKPAAPPAPAPADNAASQPLNPANSADMAAPAVTPDTNSSMTNAPVQSVPSTNAAQ